MKTDLVLNDKIIKIESIKNSYEVIITTDAISRISEFINKDYCNSKIVFIVDKKVNEIYPDNVARLKELISNRIYVYLVKEGERSKSLSETSNIYEFLSKNEIERTDLIIAFGGGVIGDLTGFVASTYKRGIDYVQVPTTLLSQIDSSIGGKVAINIDSGKNLVGSFYNPKVVITDTTFLNTLSRNQILDGFGEIIKYGLIYSKELFLFLKNEFDIENFLERSKDIIYECCNIKKIFVENDEYDNGERMKLNYGHTIGHGIEKYYGYGHYSHGQAVAMGMYMISDIFSRNGIINNKVLCEIKEILEKYGMYKPEILEDYDEIIKFLSNDKKFLDGKLNLIYVDEIGNAKIYNIYKNDVNKFFAKKI